VGEGVNYLAVCDAVTGNEAEMAKNFAAGIRAVLAGDCQSFEMEYPCHSPNEQRWFIGRVNAFPGKVPRNVSIAHENITARKLAEEALLQNTRLLRIAGRTTRIGGWQVDIGHNQVYWSEEVARIHEMPPGYQPTVEEGIAFYAPEWRDRIAEVFDVCAREGIPYDEEMEIITAKGRRVWIRTIGEAERDESGRIVRVHGAFMDISEHKQSKFEIARAAQEWQRTFDGTNHAIWILDKDLRVLRANKVSEQLFSSSKGTLLGRRCFEIVHGTERPLPDCPIFKAQKNLHRECMDLQIGDRWFEVTVDPILDEHGRFDGAVHIINDITKRKRAEQEQQQLQEQLIQAQKMETIGRLAGGVAHDFNNMLGVILGNLEMALEQVDKGSTLYADLEEAEQAAKKSVDITRQLLTFSRKGNVKPVAMDVNQSMKNMLKMLRRMIGEHITLNWQAGADASMVLMDTSHFNQMITNLCLNARDAIGERGTVSIKTGNCLLDDIFCEKYPDVVPGNYVSITVQDTGCGMTQDIIAHIFEPFYTTKEHGKGTGLGLATIYGIVKQCGGCLDVDSAPGEGTTFTIYLPQVSDEVAYSHDTREYVLPSAAKGHETVLVVEDESGILRLCCSILEKSGFTVLAALSPADALKLSDNFAEDIHLVITDVIMPEINGPQLVQRIKTMRPGIKCLYMSGYTPDIIARHKLTEQKIHCIEKPFSTQKFLAMVREILAET